MEPIVETIYLYCREGGSDKVYIPTIVDNGAAGYEVIAQWGARGSALNQTSKGAGLTLEAARKIYEKLIRDKTGKRDKPYQIDETASPKVPQSVSAAVAKIDARRLGVPIQLLNPIDESELETLLDDDNFIGTQKYDGVRRLAVVMPDRAYLGVNRKGLAVPLPHSVVEELRTLPNDTILDGELLGDHLWVFDVLRFGGKDLTPLGYGDRIRQSFIDLRRLIPNAEAIRPVYYTYGGKRELLRRLRSEHAEGIVLREASSPVIDGRPNSGGAALKFKFVETATVFVHRNDGDKRSVGIGVLDADDNAVSLGNVTIPPNAPIPRIGDLLEVRYRHANRGGGLQEPVYIGTRDDLEIADAILSQLKFKNESAAA
jgi:bifunctional non-homologous end joining protein LigD